MVDEKSTIKKRLPEKNIKLKSIIKLLNIKTKIITIKSKKDKTNKLIQ
jgi:hypothetical protein